jgi:hypothetical protein
MVSIKLTNYLQLNKLLYKHQYGFQRGLSTEHTLIHVTNLSEMLLIMETIVKGYFWTYEKLLTHFLTTFIFKTQQTWY